MFNGKLCILKLRVPIHLYGQINHFIVYSIDGDIGHAVYFAANYSEAKKEAVAHMNKSISLQRTIIEVYKSDGDTYITQYLTTISLSNWVRDV